MIADKPQPQPSVGQILQLMELLKTALSNQDFQGFGELVVSRIVGMMQLPSALLYVSDQRLPVPYFYQYGLKRDTMSAARNLCAETLDRIANKTNIQPLSVSISAVGKTTNKIRLYPLHTKEGCMGLIGFALDDDPKQGWVLDDLERISDLFASAINDFLKRLESTRQIKYLNTYLTVSSMLSQSLDLHELLEMILSCCMDVASAEAASVLLFDEEKKNLSFYQVEGPAKPVLVDAIFPADKGLAGSILQTLQSEVINDVHSDPRFYKEVDSDTGFQTRNMIAIPLVAGEEKIGVLEVLNKVEGGSFTEEEHLLLVSIAEEIAFAIRNAKLFEYVANTYCKQRQGQMSCRGCERPLGSWTPCVKYRELSL